MTDNKDSCNRDPYSKDPYNKGPIIRIRILRIPIIRDPIIRILFNKAYNVRTRTAATFHSPLIRVECIVIGTIT